MKIGYLIMSYVFVMIIFWLIGSIATPICHAPTCTSPTCPTCPTCPTPKQTIAQALVGAIPPTVIDGTQAIVQSNLSSYYNFMFSDCLNNGTCNNDISTLDQNSISAKLIKNKLAGAWNQDGWQLKLPTGATTTDPKVGTIFWTPHTGDYL